MIDRISNVVKLSQGVFVAAEKIEVVLKASPYVLQIYAHVDSTKSCVVGVVVVDPENFTKLAESLGDTRSIDKCCRSPDIKKALIEKLEKLSEEGGLKCIERLKNVHLTTEEFTVENGLLTPTFKVKRRRVKERYKAELEELY